MKKILLLTIVGISTTIASAQKETFDLISYAVPASTPEKNWKKEVTETITSYTAANLKNNSWCRINIIKSTVSKGSIEKDFESEWQDLIVKNSILGTWGISVSETSDFRVKNGIMSTILRQYTFKENGSYTCNIKTFDPIMSSIFLGRENGTYQVVGNKLTINPQKSVLEEWSKKNNADQWSKLLKTQNIPLEKLTYSFTKTYILENNEWQLILEADSQTKRDGPFNNYDRNAWIYIATSPARSIIQLPN